MKFHNGTAEVFVPDGVLEKQALARTTHMAVAAHQDDIEIMAFDGIAKAFRQPDKWFCGVVVTNGSGSPRAGLYADYTDEEMMAVRRAEQKKAAVIGEYGALVLLDYPSSAVKDRSNGNPVDDLVAVLEASHPEVVYTHNLADKHDTHVAVALRVVEAIRRLPRDERPKRLYGCEVWRDLDWLVDSDKVAFDVSSHENLQAALLGVFDSQVSGGKRYDLATLGRRRANATFFESHGVDIATGMIFAMDLTPLVLYDSLDVGEFVQGAVRRFSEDVSRRISRYMRSKR
jgi:LmbE family N-acetylglucosaminyl deacetylase